MLSRGPSLFLDFLLRVDSRPSETKDIGKAFPSGRGPSAVLVSNQLLWRWDSLSPLFTLLRAFSVVNSACLTLSCVSRISYSPFNLVSWALRSRDSAFTIMESNSLHSFSEVNRSEGASFSICSSIRPSISAEMMSDLRMTVLKWSCQCLISGKTFSPSWKASSFRCRQACCLSWTKSSMPLAPRTIHVATTDSTQPKDQVSIVRVVEIRPWCNFAWANSGEPRETCKLQKHGVNDPLIHRYHKYQCHLSNLLLGYPQLPQPS